MLYNKRIPLRLKGRIYRIVVRLTLLYGVECLPIKKYQVQRIMVAETRLLHWMCSQMRLDRNRNEVIRDKVGVTSIEDKMR